MDKAYNKILITGCSGLVGIHLVKKCLEKGYDVIGVDLKYSDSLPKSDRFTFYELDLTNEENVKNLFCTPRSYRSKGLHYKVEKI